MKKILNTSYHGDTSIRQSWLWMGMATQEKVRGPGVKGVV